MNENRSVFALDGVTGMLIATVLLLSILAYLTVAAIGAQNNHATDFYKIENEKAIKTVDTQNFSRHIVDVK